MDHEMFEEGFEFDYIYDQKFVDTLTFIQSL